MTDTATAAGVPGVIRRALHELMASEPNLRARDAAERLGISEAELVAARVGDGVRRLDAQWKELLEGLPKVGDVMVLTRNDHVVHEKTGTFDNVQASGPMGLVLASEIDLRLFLARWRYVFGVEEPTRAGPRSSIQIFAGDGTAVMKIYATRDSTPGAFEALVARHLMKNQDAAIEVVPRAPDAADRDDGEIDTAVLRRKWDSLKDVHDFLAMLNSVGVGRVQALRLAGEARARLLPNGVFRRALELAAERDVPIMIFVGNYGAIQIHTGPVRNLKEVGEWFNVLDPRFNLHVREGAIASSWIVRKPTTDGTVTALEVYDANGGQIAQMFGKRKPGEPELEDWRAIVRDLETGAG